MDTRHLIENAEDILRKIKIGDILGIGTKEEYLDDETLSIALRWAQDVHDIGAKSLTPFGQELSELWFLNGNRVSSMRIKRAIDILKQL